MAEIQVELSKIYHRRFARTAAYRNRVWQVLTKHYFQRWVPPSSTVLDLGCGYGEFINNIIAGRKIAMDLNPNAAGKLATGVEFAHQDCAKAWPFPENSLDVVFTSNFLEHLPDKESVRQTLLHALRCLKPGGRFIAVGPNVKYLHGEYWDFWDHHVYLTEASLGEAMEVEGYHLEAVIDRFLPFTMIKAPEYPLFLVQLYISLPFFWRLRGKQFLVIAKKP